MNYTQTAVANMLGITSPCVNQRISSGWYPEPEVQIGKSRRRYYSREDVMQILQLHVSETEAKHIVKRYDVEVMPYV